MHLAEQRGGELGAGAAQRVAEGDGASVDVDAVRIEVEFPDDGQGLGGKGLVEFDQADLAAEGFGNAKRGPTPISSGRQPAAA